MDKINFIEKVGDTDFIDVEGVIYGIQDISDKYDSTSEESKILTIEEKLKEFRKIIPSYEAFKNIVKEKDGFIRIEEMLHIILLDITKPVFGECYYLERIVVDPKYENAGIGSIIYSYIERMVKEHGFKCILIFATGTWQIINFYKKQGFVPTEELDARHIVPLLEKLNDRNLAITNDKGKRYMMPMIKNFPQNLSIVSPINQYTHDKGFITRDQIQIKNISLLISELIVQATNNLKCSPFDINRGSCMHVAEYVHERIPTEFGVQILSTIKLDPKFRKILPGHEWIYYNGRHYDAERPYGVNNFMDLPIFSYYKEDLSHYYKM